MTIAHLLGQPVRLDGQAVIFDHFCETDPAVVASFEAAVDIDGHAHQLLALGARVSSLASAAGDLRQVEERVSTQLEALTASTQSSVAAAMSALAEQTRSFFDADDGEITEALTSWRRDLDDHLGELFDPDHKRSVISAIEASLGAVLEAHSRRLAALSDPDVATSSAGRLLAQMRATTEEIRGEMRTLAVAVGAERARAVEHARSAVKGVEYEMAVLEAVTRAAAAHGDLVNHVGTTSGTKGTKKGDVVVTVADEDAPGGACYVIEAKDTPLSLGATWRELDAAMANRDADAAVAVFAAGSLAPTTLPFHYCGERAVVVLDRDDGDPAALQLACLWARWVVRRRHNPTGAGPDPERVTAAIERAQRALGRVSTIRRSHTTATKALSEAGRQLDELTAEVRLALADIAAQLTTERR